MADEKEVPIRSVEQWESLPEWGEVFDLVRTVVDENVSRHPGIITEALIEAMTGRYDLMPREERHRERRKNHPERIRRLSHSVFRLLDAAEGEAPVRQIAAAVLKSFILEPRGVPGG